MGRGPYLGIGAVFGAAVGFLVGQPLDGGAVGAVFGLAIGVGLALGLRDALAVRRRRRERRQRMQRRDDETVDEVAYMAIALDVDRSGTTLDPHD